MSTTPDTNYCSTCGGALRVVDGTDPNAAQDMGYFEETYQCEFCGGTGTYKVNMDGTAPSGTGVVAQ